MRWRRCLVEQSCLPRPRNELGGTTAADPEALRRRRPSDARLGSHHPDELSGAQPAHLCGLPRILCHRR
jgi:hypothetical protein